MKRRSKVSGKGAKRQRANATKSRHRAAVGEPNRFATSANGEQEKIAQLARELSDAQERQTTITEVLQAVGRSAGDPQPVFATILESVASICSASFASVLLYDGKDFSVAAMHNTSLEYVQHRYLGSTLSVSAKNPLRRIIVNKQVQHIPDIRKEEAYIDGEPAFTQLINKAGARTLLNVPLLTEREVIGVIGIYRQEVQPFTATQIGFVQNLAAQAVIAIENARLLNELRQSLEQQTATSEVLQAISSSGGELDPIFKVILANAIHLCEASFGVVHLHENGVFPVAATYKAPPSYVELRKRQSLARPDPEHPFARVAATKQVLHILDIRTEAGYSKREEALVSFADLAGGRTLLIVPMLKENDLVGTVVICRPEVQAFTDKQIDLVKTFAAQGAIAVENVRLLRNSSKKMDHSTIC